MTRLLLSLGAALLLTAGTVWAGPLEDAAAAHARGDDATAFKILQPLAAQGDADAQYNLGVTYFNGTGVPQDYAQALKWYRLSAAQGDARAQHNLAVMYEKGQGVSRDSTEAVKWFRLAADQGLQDAQHFLGLTYENGTGVSQDFIQAHKWYILAGVNGLEIADTDRDAIAKQMTPAQIAEAQQLAREWKPTGK